MSSKSGKSKTRGNKSASSGGAAGGSAGGSAERVSLLIDHDKSKNKVDMRIVYIIIAAVILVVIVIFAIVFKNKLTGKDEEIKTLKKDIKTKSLIYSDKLKAAEAERSRIEEKMKTATPGEKEELETQLRDLEAQLAASELELEEAEIALARLTTENAGLLDSLSEYLNSNVDSTPESEIIRNVRTRAEKIAGELCDCFTKQGGWDVDAEVALLSLDDVLLSEPINENEGEDPPASVSTKRNPTTGGLRHDTMYAPTGGEFTNYTADSTALSHEKKQTEDFVLNIIRSTTWGQKLMVDYNKDLADLTSEERREARTTLEQKQKAFRKCFFNTLATELDNFKKTEPSDYKTGIFISELGASMLRTKCTRSILTNIKYGQTLQLLVDAAEKQVEMVDTEEDEDPESPDGTISGTIRPESPDGTISGTIGLGPGSGLTQPEKLTYIGSGACTGDQSIPEGLCDGNHACTIIGRQSNGCWHIFAGPEESITTERYEYYSGGMFKKTSSGYVKIIK